MKDHEKITNFIQIFLIITILLVSCMPSPSGYDRTEIDISADPIQEKIEESSIIIDKKGYHFVIKPKAEYSLSGIVISKEKYHFDWNAVISPCDVAVVWGQLSEGNLFKKLRWSQYGRWYFWEWESNAPDELKDERLVARYSSNNHIIPANDRLKRAVKSLSRGEIVQLKGLLVSVSAANGGQTYTWYSSLTRNDTGEGSCEIIYLTKLRIGDAYYE